MAGLLNFIDKGGKRLIDAWHGSPYDISKFDLSYKGKGEGGAAYGVGGYTSADRGVAEGYRDYLQPEPTIRIGGTTQPYGIPLIDELAPNANFTTHGSVYSALKKAQGDRGVALRNIEADLEYELANPFGRNQTKIDSLYQTRDIIEKIPQSELSYKAPKAFLYNIGLDTDPTKMLDWQKPLSSQKGLIDMLGGPAQVIADRKNQRTGRGLDLVDQMGAAPRSSKPPVDPMQLTGKDIYYGMGETYQDRIKETISRLEDGLSYDMQRMQASGIDPTQTDLYKNAIKEIDVLKRAYSQPLGAISNQLYDRGVGGITYMGEFNRTGGEGARNFVSFNADDMKILKKYLHPATLGGGGILGSMLGQEDDDAYY